MSLESELGPPPPPRPVKMPEMPLEVKQQLGGGNHIPSSGPPMVIKSAPMMGGMPVMGGMPTMMGGGGGYPTVGGMGPNLVFNFSSPYPAPYCYGQPIAMAPTSADGGEGKGEKKDKDKNEKGKEKDKGKPKEKPKVIYVQGNPTFSNPRRVAEKGKPRAQGPCIIM